MAAAAIRGPVSNIPLIGQPVSASPQAKRPAERPASGRRESALKVRPLNLEGEKFSSHTDKVVVALRNKFVLKRHCCRSC